ncbi:MAG: hypothetical protein Q4P33_05755 [Flaviflexus sp.]|nr:hypothetical protein [Flaviflexus sp.]
MGKLFPFTLGVGLGYVLGARAGKERYEQIKNTSQKIWENDHVQNSVDKVAATAKDVAATQASRAKDAALSAFDKAQDKAADLAEDAEEAAEDLGDKADEVADKAKEKAENSGRPDSPSAPGYPAARS